MSSLDTNHQKAKLEHLDQIQALSTSMASAISALERSDVQQLQNDIAAQEMLCGKLRTPAWLLPSATSPSTSQGASQADDLLDEIRQAYTALAQLNRVYASLVRRSQRSVGLVAALYRSYENGYGTHPAAPEDKRSWSCEV